jgi:hypothetical protein
MRISLPLPQPVHIASTHARSRSRQATPAQADAATPGPARGSHAARAEAPADEATPGPSRLQRRALLAVPLGSLLAPRALASGSPYDDVLPPVGVLNGCVTHARSCSRVAVLAHLLSGLTVQQQSLAAVPVDVQLREYELPQQRPVHGSLGCSARAQERQSCGGRDSGSCACSLSTG